MSVDPVPVAIAEINAHTGEGRLHSIASFLAVVHSRGLKYNGSFPQLPWDTKHAWFRKATEQDLLLTKAGSDGSWGMETVEVMCSFCSGSGVLKFEDSVSKEIVRCWECHGTGKLRVLKSKFV